MLNSKDLKITYVLLNLLALKPFLDLFWDYDIGGVKVIWFIYPIHLLFIFLISLVFFLNGKTKVELLLISILAFNLVFHILFNYQISYDSYLRISLSITYLAFFSFAFKYQFDYKLFFKIYFLFLIIPIVIGILQYLNLYPNYEFDWVDGNMIPRATGGYSKPNNFGAYLLPLYTYILILYVKGNSKLVKLSCLILLFIVILYVDQIIKYRTWTIIYFSMFLFFILRKFKFIFNIRFIFFSWFSILILFYSLLLSFKNFFLMQGWLLRGRVSNWTVHLSEFFSSNYYSILLGRARIFTDYYKVDDGGFAIEFHSDFGRVLITYGLLTFIVIYFYLYVWCKRYFVSLSSQTKPIYMGLVLGFLLYSTTNETLHYSSIFLCFLLSFWIVIIHDKNANYIK